MLDELDKIDPRLKPIIMKRDIEGWSTSQLSTLFNLGETRMKYLINLGHKFLREAHPEKIKDEEAGWRRYTFGHGDAVLIGDNILLGYMRGGFPRLEEGVDEEAAVEDGRYTAVMGILSVDPVTIEGANDVLKAGVSSGRKFNEAYFGMEPGGEHEVKVGNTRIIFNGEFEMKSGLNGTFYIATEEEIQKVSKKDLTAVFTNVVINNQQEVIEQVDPRHVQKPSKQNFSLGRGSAAIIDGKYMIRFNDVANLGYDSPVSLDFVVPTQTPVITGGELDQKTVRKQKNPNTAFKTISVKLKKEDRNCYVGNEYKLTYKGTQFGARTASFELSSVNKVNIVPISHLEMMQVFLSTYKRVKEREEQANPQAIPIAIEV